MFTEIISWAKGLFDKNSRKAMPAQLSAEQAMEIINDLADHRSAWELTEEHLGKWSSLKAYRKADQEVVLVCQGEDYLITDARVTKGEISWCPDELSEDMVAELDEIWFYNLDIRLAAAMQAAADMEMEEYA